MAEILGIRSAKIVYYFAPNQRNDGCGPIFKLPSMVSHDSLLAPVDYVGAFYHQSMIA
jgi:hypothetical protein